jgi:hypothetical protein
MRQKRIESINEWDEQLKAIERIPGDRRVDRRYDLKLELCWNLMRGRRIIDSGSGISVNLSSGGILFDAGRTLPLGFNVKLFISWPVLLNNTVPLHLIVSGRILRIASNYVVIRMGQHEFHTAAHPAEQHSAPQLLPA